MLTIGEQLQRHRGVGPGFDTVRLALATLVLFIHTSLIAPGVAGLESAPLFPYAPIDRWAVNYAALPMFFALSGFLVGASAERLSLGNFLANRAFRIFPALGVEITLSALVLGPLLTTLPLAAYFADPKFAHYFLNILGSIHYELPGVFTSNPEPNIVNGALWTVPHELSCYALLASFMLFGLHRSRRLLLVATLGLFAVGILIPIVLAIYPALPFGKTLSYIFVERGAARLVPVFLTGMLIYRYRDILPFRRSYAFLAIGAYFAICAFGQVEWGPSPLFNAATAPLLAYAVAVAGLSPELKFSAVNGDYSYGIYLYGFPLQQTILLLFPGMTSVALFFAMAFVASLAMAALSWNFIEKPILRLRRRRSVAGQIHTEPTTSEPLQAAVAAVRRSDPAAA